MCDKKLEERIVYLENKLEKLSNVFLNIKFNSTLFLKIMKLEQREIKRDQEIAVLNKKISEL